MNKTLDMLLVNSLAPRHRIASDASLENSLAIIRTHLENKGFSIHVVDEQRLSAISQGVPNFLQHILAKFANVQISASSRGMLALTLFLILCAWPFQALSLYLREQYLKQLASKITALVKSEQTPLVGIKLWYGDAYGWSKLLAETIRSNCPEATVIAGGPHVKVYGEHIFDDNPAFDLAIMGPGEFVLEKLLALRKLTATKKEFLAAVHQKSGQSRLIRSGQFEKKNDFSTVFSVIPKYTFADLQDKILFHTLVDGIGCSWNQCNFCSHTRQCVNHIPRPIEYIKQEILEMTATGIGFFRFSSSETPISQGTAIANMLLKENIHIHYSMFIRAGKVTKDTYNAFRLMIRSGLRAVFMGGETGHDQINNHIMNKGVTRQEIADTIHAIKLAAADEGITCRVGLAMIYPCPVIPGVSLEDIFQANLSLIQETLPDAVIVNPPGIFPGTAWFDDAEKFGFAIGRDFVTKLMNYEYSIYKPVELWPKLDIALNGQDVPTLLKEAGRLRRAVEDLGIPMGVSDELLMMIDAIGMSSKHDLLEFRKQSLIDIMSGSSQYISGIAARINEYGRNLAYSNHPRSNQSDLRSPQDSVKEIAATITSH